ncbi:MAG: hypothetical protein RLY89_2747, partial [Bacteroidota bacterium]
NSTLFKEITSAVKINYTQAERDFVDFNIQKLIPHKFSEYGPALAVGDVDGNGLDDLITGGSFSYSSQLFLQQSNGIFVQKPVIAKADINTKRWEDLGILLFDADGDADLDLYTVSGGYENQRNTEVYQDKFYLNDGKGNFTLDINAIPKNYTSKACVRSIDYDKDGDLDLFVSGRVDPWNYPKPVSSFIYRNDTKNGKVQFTDVTTQVAPALNNLGLVCDAVFTDYDQDGWPDLILAGEWMPITVLKNEKGQFKNATASTGVQSQTGWWNTIAPGDFDNDGDLDYVLGNLGQNSFYRASPKTPVGILAKDFDKNDSYDAFPYLYLPDQEGQLKPFPAQTRDDMVKQMISMRSKFQNYKTYAVTTIDKIFTEEQMKDAQKLEAVNLQSVLMRNDGNGQFSFQALPKEAQFSVLNGMVADDFDGDGNLDLVINGNDYGTEVSVGRYDALNGLFLKGDGKGGFAPLSILQSGIFIPGNGKGLVKLRHANGKTLLAAAQNRGPLKIFELKSSSLNIPLLPSDRTAHLSLSNGKKQVMEAYYGASFLSQSGRFLTLGAAVKGLSITNAKGETRNVSLK